MAHCYLGFVVHAHNGWTLMLLPFTERQNNAIQQIALILQPSIERMSEAFIALGNTLRQDIRLYEKILNSFRFPNEPIQDYVKRNPSALANPDIRWEYQVYIWSTPIQWVHQAIKSRIERGA